MTERPANPRYWLERRAKKRTGYPSATLAFYGPDDRRASKAVVTIVEREKSDPAEAPIRKWFTDTSDARHDAQIAQEILDYLDEFGVQRVITIGRLIGCPHEEKIDYPEGEVCPECPFWANIDRWTGERL